MMLIFNKKISKRIKCHLPRVGLWADHFYDQEMFAFFTRCCKGQSAVFSNHSTLLPDHLGAIAFTEISQELSVVALPWPAGNHSHVSTAAVGGRERQQCPGHVSSFAPVMPSTCEAGINSHYIAHVGKPGFTDSEEHPRGRAGPLLTGHGLPDLVLWRWLFLNESKQDLCSYNSSPSVRDCSCL